jgi:hypothetical protein
MHFRHSIWACFALITWSTASAAADVKSVSACLDQLKTARAGLSRVATAYFAVAAEREALQKQQVDIASLQAEFERQQQLLLSTSSTDMEKIAFLAETLKRLKSDLDRARALKVDFEKKEAESSIACAAISGQSTIIGNALYQLEKDIASPPPAEVLSDSAWKDVMQQIGDNLAQINRAFDQVAGQASNCIGVRPDTDAFSERIGQLSPAKKDLKAISEQRTRLKELKRLIEDFSKSVDQNDIHGSTATKLLNVIKKISGASVDQVIASLESGRLMQVIDAPEQPWERVEGGDFFKYAGGASIALGGILQLSTSKDVMSADGQTVQVNKPFWKNPIAFTPVLLGVASTIVGEVWSKNETMPPVLQEGASRLATNRIVGLTIQQQAEAVTHAQARFKAALPEEKIAPTVIIPSITAAQQAVIVEIDRLLSVLSPEAKKPLTKDDFIAFKTTYAKWQTDAEAAIEATKRQSKALTDQLDGAQRGVSLFATVLEVTNDSAAELKGLIGESVANSLCAKTKSVTCVTKQDVSTKHFCEDIHQSSKRSHFAAQFLSDTGKDKLLTLGACTVELVSQARKDVNEALTDLTTVRAPLQDWETKFGSRPMAQLLSAARTEATAVAP